MRATSGESMRGGDDWVERVRAASDIIEVVGQGIALKKVGRNWVGLCPFHQEKTPSFSVNPDRQFYHCFSCKAGGDVFKFIQETEKLGFVEAVELLSRRANIPVPERRSGETGVRRPLLDALDAAATLYEQWLGDPHQGAAVRAYLEGRGLTHDTLREFRLGVAPAGWENLVQRLRERCGEGPLLQAGLAARRDRGGSGLYDRFRNRLMIPLVAPGGTVVGFGARALAPQDEPKYLNSPETPVYHKGAFLYGLEQARKHVETEGELVVVEGYFDVIALHQAGIRNTVATSGTALTAEQAKLLHRAARRVALTYDGDEAGQDAMMRSLGVLLTEGLEVVVVDLPRGDDPDTLIRRGGVEAWQEMRRSAKDPIEFIQRHGLRRGVSGDPRERALQAVVDLVAGIGDPIRLRLLIERAGQVFGLAESVLSRAVTLKQSGQKTEAPIAAAVRQQATGESYLERELLRALLLAPATLEDVKRQVSPEDFHHPTCATLAGWLWSGEPGSPTDEAAAALERELVADPMEGVDRERAVADNVRNMLKRRMEREQRRIRLRILDLQRQGRGEAPEALQLMHEIHGLGETLRDLARNQGDWDR